MVEPHMVRVLGRSAFHDTDLTSSGDLCYHGGEVLDIDVSWRLHKVSDGQRRRVQIVWDSSSLSRFSFWMKSLLILTFSPGRPFGIS
ncbi:hypothetical protein Bca52824_023906 [Brassica carinata]|uniref:Uncharacterized protein n=1 Tax=Brassica carinata TaxID=52824 RepID=A0A8X7VJG8_BRACI|nr:hypothetical protein Bca52824_023906 [Brassica carinata]